MKDRNGEPILLPASDVKICSPDKDISRDDNIQFKTVDEFDLLKQQKDDLMIKSIIEHEKIDMLEWSNYNQKTVILALKNDIEVAREEKIYINNVHNETRVNY